MMRPRGAFGFVTGIVALALGIALAAANPASADSAPAGMIGSFPTWTSTASSGPGTTFAGTAAFATSAGFPGVSWTTNASTAQSPSGQSTFLGSSTGFGQTFGSTRAEPYLSLSTAAAITPSTTTLTFAGAPPAGWGFALGDVDADFVEIVARNAANAIVPAADLGAQDTGGNPLLNYCNNVPKPSGCTGPGPFTDFPTWHPAGAVIGGTPYSNPLVLGSGTDTSGAYDWFLPGSDIRSLTFIFHAQSGSPIFQVWLAAQAPVSTITGTIVPPAGAPVPTGIAVDLQQADGTPVRDIQDNPVAAPVAPDGTFTIATEEDTYRLAFTVPPGYAPIPTRIVDATTAAVAVDPIALTLELASTGVDSGTPLGVGLLAVAGGLVVLLFARRRRACVTSPSGSGSPPTS